MFVASEEVKKNVSSIWECFRNLTYANTPFPYLYFVTTCYTKMRPYLGHSYVIKLNSK